MAVDTRDKRFSMMGLAQTVVWVATDPSVNGVQETEFEQWLHGYSGIQFTGPGDPRMKRWGGVPNMRVSVNFAGRSW